VYNRSIPQGFKVKTGSVIREVDGWYISFTIEDKTIPVGLWAKRKIVSVIFTLTTSRNIPLSPVNLITEK